jgi:hypothetical protein
VIPFCQDFALTFAGRLYESLSGPRSIGIRQNPGRQETFFVVGNFILKAHGENSGEVVSLNLQISKNWVSEPPEANIYARFIRKDRDWHYQTDGKLCYVLQKRWERQLQEVFQSVCCHTTLIEFAAAWCFAGIDSLAVRHLIGFRNGLTQWPAGWAEYKHGKLGWAQFDEEERLKQVCLSSS